MGVPVVSCDLLLVSAFQPEIAPLRAALGEGMHARVGGREVIARTVGIGLAAAAVGTSMQLAATRPRAVVLLGTCGAYRATGEPLGLGIGHVIASERLRLMDPAAVDGAAQFPEPMAVASEGDPGLVDGLVRAGACAADVATTLAVTVDDALADRIARSSHVHVEHLEAHGVAAACSVFGVPFVAVLGVANFVGPTARAEWRAHHLRASEASVETVLRWLHQESRTP